MVASESDLTICLCYCLFFVATCNKQEATSVNALAAFVKFCLGLSHSPAHPSRASRRSAGPRVSSLEPPQCLLAAHRISLCVHILHRTFICRVVRI